MTNPQLWVGLLAILLVMVVPLIVATRIDARMKKYRVPTTSATSSLRWTPWRRQPTSAPRPSLPRRAKRSRSSMGS